MEQNAQYMCEMFKRNKPFLIGRNGTIELQTLSKYYYGGIITEDELNKLELNAGLFPRTSFNSFFEEYTEALENTDAIAEGWYEPLKQIEKIILNSLNKNRYTLFLRNLEPYYVKPEYRWTQYLAGNRVAIINSFAKTCETQTYISKAIWPDYTESLLPSSTVWVPINTYYSNRLADTNTSCAWPEHINSWKDAVNDVVSRVLNEGCQIAIIGCGGMGMIIGNKLKEKGLKCIVMGGATQILFGIRGKRWETHDVISKFFNDSWIQVPDEFKPKNYKLVENGCYW